MRLLGPTAFACLWVVLGCDRVLSRWDRVQVQVSEPGPLTSEDSGSTDDGTTDGPLPGGGSTGGGTTGPTDKPLPVVVDHVAPEPLQTFTVEEGSDALTIGTTVGTNKITMDFPNAAGTLADYKTVTIRRKKGAVPDDCSDGALAKIYNSPTFPDPDTFFDFAGEAGVSFGYRVCIKDAAGNETSSDTAANKVTKPHILYATSQGYSGDLSGPPAGGGTGLARADYICAQTSQGSATAAVAIEPHWKAVMSDSTVSARNRLTILGEVKNSSLAISLFDDHNGFWQTPIHAYVDDDVGGVPPNLYTLTGSTVNGLKAGAGNYCLDWKSASVGEQAALGNDDPNAGGFVHWLRDHIDLCSGTYSLYCVSQPAEPILTAMSVTPGATVGTVVSLTLPMDASLYHSIELYRSGTNPAPSAECDSGDVGPVSFTSGGSTAVYEDLGAAISGHTYYYRACVFDALGNIVTTKTANGTAP